MRRYQSARSAGSRSRNGSELASAAVSAFAALNFRRQCSKLVLTLEVLEEPVPVVGSDRVAEHDVDRKRPGVALDNGDDVVPVDAALVQNHEVHVRILPHAVAR